MPTKDTDSTTRSSSIVKAPATSEERPPLGEPLRSDIGLLRRWRRVYPDPDSIATQPSVFDDPTGLRTHRPPPEYENAHRFDPKARWTWREERNIVRKIDTRILMWTGFMFFCLELDRSNITQANADNFLNDLGLTTDDYNIGQSLFKASFLFAELPSQIIAKRVGADRWMPCQMIMWSIVATSQFWLSGRASFFATRCLIGICQGGFIPDAVLFLSYFYTNSELPVRFAFFWMSNYLADAAGAFMAAGLLKLRGVDGRAGWQYLFLVEGLLTLAVGLLSIGIMPAGPTQTRRWWTPNGWFTEREEVIMVNRVLRDDPMKSDMHNREGLNIQKIVDVLGDWRMWPLYLIGLTFELPTNPPTAYLTLSLRDLGFGTIQTTLLTLPSTFLGITMSIFVAAMSELVNSRTAMGLFFQLWMLPLLISLYTFSAEASAWVYFAVITLLVGCPNTHPMQVGWVSRNSQSVRTRSVSASLYNISVQLGGIMGSYVYRTDDEVHKRGNRVLISITSMNIVLYLLIFVFYRTINGQRKRIWNRMSPSEKDEYKSTSRDEGNARLDFMFAY
ncbi:MFS general substrate transporter [Fistulina hepatica ATCC 64428]|uniref:MFS general substrate transporter n=1 Tax=Fistulina hepatica ATCC 64428 TaxID=1128425 RepID=A0A0D7AN76_9AGAR|nr:MFS general substrate transporter [Fistulina hepatica ATCC 64428]